MATSACFARVTALLAIVVDKLPVPPEAESLADVVKPPGCDDARVTVWENGHRVRDWTFAEVRSRADAARL